MRVCFIIDPIEQLKPKKDSSMDLASESQNRGHSVDFCTFSDVSILQGAVIGKVRSLKLATDFRSLASLNSGNTEIGDERDEDYSNYDVIFIRKDPPYDSDYFSLCLLLDPLEGQVKFVNSPRGLRLISEKLTASLFPDHCPKTVATYDIARARAFASQFDKVVLKPSYLGSGEGIFVSSAKDEDFEKNIEVILKADPKGPVIVQEFLPEIVDGDVRVMLLNGEFLGAVGRVPPPGDFRANIAIGGTETAVELSPKQSEIATEIGAFLKRQKIVYAGLDFIGDRLIEINVTSPTLIQELRRVSGIDASKQILDALE